MLELIEDFEGYLRSDFLAQKMPRLQNDHHFGTKPKVVSEKAGCPVTLYKCVAIETDDITRFFFKFGTPCQNTWVGLPDQVKRNREFNSVDFQNLNRLNRFKMWTDLTSVIWVHLFSLELIME